MQSRTLKHDPDPVSTAESDRALEKLFEEDFDVIDFLNANLPPLSLASQPAQPKNGRLAQLQEPTSFAQNLLSKVNAHNVRSSNLLTQTTDEILRSGSRLAYEVEILRGDVNALCNALTDTLQDDLAKFSQKALPGEPDNEGRGVNGAAAPLPATQHLPSETTEDQLPSSFIPQLQTLQQARSRLEQTIRTFGDAMNWPFPPPSPTLTSSLISVSAPELGLESTPLPASAGGGGMTQNEATARAMTKALQAEFSQLATTDPEAAEKRIKDLQELAIVWKGTSEERSRSRFIESLSKVVEERRTTQASRAGSRSRPDGNTSNQHRSGSLPARGMAAAPVGSSARTDSPARGLLRNLQKLRDEIYLE